jgi:hypothetical protein
VLVLSALAGCSEPCPLGRLLYVRYREPQQVHDVLIVDGVEDLPASPTGTDEAHAAQQPELMGDRRLADADQPGEVADAELARGERVDDADPGGVAEDAESLDDFGDGPVRQQPTTAKSCFGLWEVRQVTMQL